MTDQPLPPPDPYKGYTFRLKMMGNDVAGFSRISALNPPVEAIRANENVPTKQRASFDAVMLERGVSFSELFVTWATRIWDFRQSNTHDEQVELQDFRQDLTLDLYNELGKIAVRYTIYRAWPSELVQLPRLDDDGVTIQSITLQNAGWEKDASFIA